MNSIRPTIRPTLAALALFAASGAEAEIFVDVGVTAARIESRINGGPGTIDVSDESLHAGFGVRRVINERSDVGVGLEIDEIDSNLFLGIRAIDYRRHPTDRIAVGFFVGAARLDLATPAYGWYLGAGIEIEEVIDDWGIGIDVRFGDKVARDNLLPGEPGDASPDNFHDVTAVTIYLSRRF